MNGPGRTDDMSTPLDPRLQANSDYQRIEFIKGELALCFTFSVVASAKYEAGNNRESAERSLANAEKIYAGVSPLVSDPKHSKHLTAELIEEFTAELERLRERLDCLQRFRK